MVSDLTPEEARASDLLWQAYEEQDWKLVRSLVRDVRALEDDAVAAVAAERERIVKLLRAEAADRMVSDPRGCLIIRDFTDRWVAREGSGDA